MDKVEDELEFHRHNGDLEMVVRLEWRNLVQPELRAVPRVDSPFLFERGLPPDTVARAVSCRQAG